MFCFSGAEAACFGYGFDCALGDFEFCVVFLDCRFGSSGLWVEWDEVLLDELFSAEVLLFRQVYEREVDWVLVCFLRGEGTVKDDVSVSEAFVGDDFGDC